MDNEYWLQTGQLRFLEREVLLPYDFTEVVTPFEFMYDQFSKRGASFDNHSLHIATDAHIRYVLVDILNQLTDRDNKPSVAPCPNWFGFWNTLPGIIGHKDYDYDFGLFYSTAEDEVLYSLDFFKKKISTVVLTQINNPLFWNMSVDGWKELGNIADGNFNIIIDDYKSLLLNHDEQQLPLKYLPPDNTYVISNTAHVQGDSFLEGDNNDYNVTSIIGPKHFKPEFGYDDASERCDIGSQLLYFFRHRFEENKRIIAKRNELFDNEITERLAIDFDIDRPTPHYPIAQFRFDGITHSNSEQMTYDLKNFYGVRIPASCFFVDEDLLPTLHEINPFMRISTAYEHQNKIRYAARTLARYINQELC